MADFAIIEMALREGATSKIGEGKIWERGLTGSPPYFFKFQKKFSRQNFWKKKINGGKGPTGPPNIKQLDILLCRLRVVSDSSLVVLELRVGNSATFSWKKQRHAIAVISISC